MSDAGLAAGSIRQRSASDWLVKPCPSDTCGEMNHARRNNCKACGTKLSTPEPKAKKVKAKPPSGPPRGASNGILTRSAKIALTKKAKQQPVLQDPVATGLVANACDDPPILTDIQAAEAAFVQPAPHQPPAPPAVAAPEPTGPTGPYIAMRECRTTVNGTLVTWAANKVVYDLNLVRIFLAEGMPIVPVADVGDVVCCPNCKHVFKRERPAGQG